MQVSFNTDLTRTLPTTVEMVLNCRYYKARDSTSFQPITGDRFFDRGIGLSEYNEHTKHVILRNTTNHTNTNNTSNIVYDDIYQRAIRKLHISVVPESLPCRTQEKGVLQGIIREFIKTDKVPAPIYISGMPGE